MPRILVIVIALLAAGGVRSQTPAEEETPRVRTAAEMPKVASSADRFVEVVAADVPGDTVGFRLPILQFTTRMLREVERVYHLQMPRGEPGLIIHALEGRSNDVRVVSRVLRRGKGVLTRVWLPSPGHSDLEALRFAIAKAYFRAWIDRHRPKGATIRGVSADPPDWLVQGALRAMDGEIVDEDKRQLLELWSTASMPYFPRMCADLHAGVGMDAVFCGYIVAWMKEKKLFTGILEDLAAGKTIDPADLARQLTSEKEPDQQDRASDERLARLTRSVLSPGFASPWDLKVFVSRLLLYSPEFDKNIGAMGTSCTFREAITQVDANPVIREVAWQKAREMPFCAIGRGQKLAEVSEAYRRFLVGLARGEKAETLSSMLDAADAQMQEILNENRKDDNR